MKLESLVCGTTWVLMNALLVMIAVEPLSMVDQKAPPVSYFETVAPAPGA